MNKEEPVRKTSARSTEGLFQDFIRRREQGEQLEFEEFCANHPEFSQGLRLLYTLFESDGGGSDVEGTADQLDVRGCPEVEDEQHLVRECIDFAIQSPLAGRASAESLHASQEALGHVVRPLDDEIAVGVRQGQEMAEEAIPVLLQVAQDDLDRSALGW